MAEAAEACKKSRPAQRRPCTGQACRCQSYFKTKGSISLLQASCKDECTARMSAVCTAWPALICIRPGGTQLSLSCISDYSDGMTPGLKSTTPAGTSQFISQMPRIPSSHAAPLQLHEHAVISGNIWQISLLEVAGCGELLRGQHLAKND